MSVTTSDLPIRTSRSAWQKSIELLGSMRFAISMLVILAIASIIGTVLKQEDPYPNYVNQFGPFWADIFRSLGLYNMYSAWWFMAILGFLIVSVSLCVLRNGPKMIADTKSWKDKVHEGSLKAFHHKAEYAVPGSRSETVATIADLVGRSGYKYVVREKDQATLISAKRGALAKIGYIFAHVAFVVICIGGLLDSNLPVRLQMLLFGKTAIHSNAVINEIAPEHRLSPSNPSFRGYAWVPEGQQVSTAILNQQDGTVIQDLPFSVQLNKFIVDYYSTGMPKLFASDIVIIDHKTGKRVPARVEVNSPVTYDGVAIYQSSFQDGGSSMKMTGYPMSGASAKPFAFGGIIGNSAPLGALGNDDTVEFTDFRAINVEDVSGGSGKPDARGVAHQSLKEKFDERLGSGAKTTEIRDLRNVGPSVQYKVRDKNGQALEFNNYMLPVDVNGEQMFLAGMRSDPDAPFRYLRIPADSKGTVNEWMLLRAALQNPDMREEAARRFAARSVPEKNSALQQHLQESALRVLTLFAGSSATQGTIAAAGQQNGGFQAVATFIDHSVPKAEQQKAAELLLRMLEGSTWDLWQVGRQQAGEPTVTPTPQNSRFVQSSLNALSDSFFYGSPVFLQLDSFKQVQASVFQLSRAPGKNIVYLGSLLLVLGIFSMFFVRERRLWFWLKDSGSGSHVMMAMSTARKTLEFDKEFAHMRATIGTALQAPLPAASSDAAPTTE